MPIETGKVFASAWASMKAAVRSSAKRAPSSERLSVGLDRAMQSGVPSDSAASLRSTAKDMHGTARALKQVARDADKAAKTAPNAGIARYFRKTSADSAKNAERATSLGKKFEGHATSVERLSQQSTTRRSASPPRASASPGSSTSLGSRSLDRESVGSNGSSTRSTAWSGLRAAAATPGTIESEFALRDAVSKQLDTVATGRATVAKMRKAALSAPSENAKRMLTANADRFEATVDAAHARAGMTLDVARRVGAFNRGELSGAEAKTLQRDLASRLKLIQTAARGNVT